MKRLLFSMLIILLLSGCITTVIKRDVYMDITISNEMRELGDVASIKDKENLKKKEINK